MLSKEEKGDLVEWWKQLNHQVQITSSISALYVAKWQ